jgi:hypothetical protein
MAPNAIPGRSIVALAVNNFHIVQKKDVKQSQLLKIKVHIALHIVLVLVLIPWEIKT